MSIESHIDRRLHDLRDQIDYPETPELAVAVLDRIGSSPPRQSRRWLQVAVAALIFLVVLIGVIPALRDTLAAWLGIGGVRIERVGDTDWLPSGINLGRGASTGEAAETLRRIVPTSDVLGRPDQIFISEPRVTLVFVGQERALLTIFPGDLEPAILKQIPDDSSFELVAVNGEDAVWITGAPHAVFFFDARGNFDEDTGHLAGNTLLWELGRYTLRLEGVSNLGDAIRIAESFG